MWQQIKAKREEQAAVFAEMRNLLKPSEDEKRDLTAEESGKFDELNAKAEGYTKSIDQLERAYTAEKSLEERATLKPGRNPVDGGDKPEQRTEVEQREEERRVAFDHYLRGEVSDEEMRVLTIGGGVVGPQGFSTKLVTSLKYYGGVLQAGAEVLNTQDGNPFVIPTATDTANSGSQIAENGAVNSTDPTLSTVTLGSYKFDSDWIKISVELSQDNGYDLEGKILDMASRRIGRKLNTATTTGTGSSQIQGFITGGSSGKTFAGAAAITYDELIDVQHSVDAAYRNGGKCVFQMNDSTLAAVRKLKDTEGHYIWMPGAVGVPTQLLGSGYVINNDMAVLATGNKTVAYGDFGAGYVVRFAGPPQVVVARELFSGNGLIGYRVFQRFDGKTQDAGAYKYGTQA